MTFRNAMPLIRTLILLWLTAFGATAVALPPMNRDDIPAPLKPWVPWALHGSAESTCPLQTGQTGQTGSGETRRCIWPGQLELRLAQGGGSFAQTVRVYAAMGAVAGDPVWTPLPGSTQRWPQDVQAGGKAQAVIAQGQTPGIFLPAGEHRLTGRFVWQALPENLAVPAMTGLIALSINGQAVAEPRWDESGLLTRTQGARESREAEKADLRISRLITDDIPLTITTRIELFAAGKNREITLSGILPPDAVPLTLASSLPARLDANQKLLVQIRPGQWEITLTARLPAPVAALAAPKIDGVTEEVWAFAARPALRQVTISGPAQIDPQQTTLPADWRKFPVYRLKPGERLSFAETRRGDVNPNPDQLTLSRQLWLDFDGAGYTVKDDIAGSLTQSWRLSMQAPLLLGRAASGGRDQLLTEDAGKTAGIEVRMGQAQISADARLPSSARELPAVGWNFDAQQVQARLHLPPGWRLLAAPGVDKAEGAWVSRWSLLDFFLVLVAAVAALRMWGWRWGAVTLLLLVLTWHEPGAPRWAWINLLAAAALARALAATRAGVWLTRYRNIAWLAVLVIALPFAVVQMRATLYPSLEMPGRQTQPLLAPNENAAAVLLRDAVSGIRSNGVEADSVEARNQAAQAMAKEERPAPAAAPAPAPAPAEATTAEDPRVRRALSSSKQSARGYEMFSSGSGEAREKAKISVDEIDPKAVVQTGPGLPRWQWRSHQLAWSGPVEKSQTFTLWLLAPWAKALIVLLHLLLAAALLVRAFDLAHLARPGVLRRSAGAANALLLLGLLSPPGDSLAAAPAPKVAEENSAKTVGGSPFPGDALLQELRERLTAPPPACRPECATITRLRVENSGDELRLRLEIHAAEASAVPLPGGPKQWTPAQALLDAKPAPVLRGENEMLLIAVPAGVHQITLSGRLPQRDAVQLALPLKPRHVEAALSGWRLDGADANGVAEDTLQLTRMATAAAGRGVGGGVATGAATGAANGAGTSSTGTAAGASEGNITPFTRIERIFSLGLEWRVTTRVIRVNAPGQPVVVEYPLLLGESVISADVKAEGGKARINLAPQANEASFDSTLKIAPSLKLTAAKQSNWVETWALDAGTQWQVTLAGIPMTHRQSNGRHLPRWQPWPGEEVTISVVKPAAVAGAWLTLDQAVLEVKPGSRVTEMDLRLSLRASRGGEHVIGFPAGVTLQSASTNNQSEPLKLDGGKLKLAITPGAQLVALTLRLPEGLGLSYRTPAIDLNLPGLNQHVQLHVPAERWVLGFSGPRLGPAILLWGVVLVLAVAGFGLGRVPATPLKSWQWILLLLGLTQTDVFAGVVIVGWLFALAARERAGQRLDGSRWFNAMQAALMLLTLLALVSLLSAVKTTLLGAPEMQIEGNGSHASLLRWFQDRGDFPSVTLISLPLWVWRGIMLAWAFWLAWSLIGWLRWGWGALNAGGLWRKAPPKSVPPVQPEQASEPANEEPKNDAVAKSHQT